jgi:hypothetical protein
MTTTSSVNSQSGHLQQVLARLRIPKEDRLAAIESWRREANFLRAGHPGSDLDREIDRANEARTADASLQSTQYQYVQLQRLRSEFDALIDFYNGSGDRRKRFFIVDPHLINTYADYSLRSGLAGFEFIRGEFGTASEPGNQLHDFVLQLLSALFRQEKLAVTRAGRDALVETVTFFSERNVFEDKPLRARLEQFRRITEVLDDELDTNWDCGHKLERRFQKLVAAGSAGALYPEVQLARMNRALRSGKFTGVRELISSTVSAEQRSDVLRLFDAVNLQGDYLASGQLGIDGAFRAFLVETDLSGRRGQDEVGLRTTDHLHRRALFEIHVANLCLDVVGADFDLGYLSFSSRLYAFLAPLERSLRVPLVHPRFAFGFRNETFFQKIRDPCEKIMAPVSATLLACEQDNRVSAQELDKIGKFGDLLRGVSDATAFLSLQDLNTQSREIVDGIADAAAQTLKRLNESGGATTDQEAVCTRLLEVAHEYTKQLETTLKSVPGEIGGLAGGATSDPAYDVFRSMSKELDPATLPVFAVRLVRDAGSSSVSRIVCLPLTGSYRYMFAITNSAILQDVDVIEKLGEEQKRFTSEEFTKIIEDAISKFDRKSVGLLAKGQSLQFLIQAIHAASLRDWAYAELRARQAAEKLASLPESSRTENFYFLSNEISFLRHLAGRALAEQRSRGRPHLRALCESARHLHDAAAAMIKAYEVGGGKGFIAQGPFLGTMTTRIPLAFAAWFIEISRALREVGTTDCSAIMALYSDFVLPVTEICADGKTFAWIDAGFEGLSCREISTSQHSIADRVRAGLCKLVDKIKLSLRENEESSQSEFDKVLWNYRLMRALQILQFSTSLSDQSSLGRGDDSQRRSNVLLADRSYEECVGRFRSFASRILLEDPAVLERTAPFANVLVQERAWKQAETHELIVKASERLLAFSNLRKFAKELDPVGLPKAHALAALSNWGDELEETLNKAIVQIREEIGSEAFHERTGSM